MKPLHHVLIPLLCILSVSSSRAENVTIRDQAGRDVVIRQPVERVVTTFIPATIFALSAGLSDKLVGASTMDESGSIYQAHIDHEHPPVIVGNRSVGLNLETIASLRPDLVILYGQKDGVRLADRLTTLGFPAIIIVPESLEEMKNSLDIIGTAAGKKEHTDKVIAAMNEITQKVRTRVSGKNNPSVYYATSSLLRTVSGDMLQNEMISLAGGNNVSRKTKGFFISVSREQLFAWNPEIILCSDRLPQKELDRLKSPEFFNLAAQKDDNVFRIPEETYWDFPSPLAMAGVLWMSSTIHPEVYKEGVLQQEIQQFYDTIFGDGFSEKFPGVVGESQH